MALGPRHVLITSAIVWNTHTHINISSMASIQCHSGWLTYTHALSLSLSHTHTEISHLGSSDVALLNLTARLSLYILVCKGDKEDNSLRESERGGVDGDRTRRVNN